MPSCTNRMFYELLYNNIRSGFCHLYITSDLDFTILMVVHISLWLATGAPDHCDQCMNFVGYDRSLQTPLGSRPSKDALACRINIYKG